MYTGILSKPIQKSEGDCWDLSRRQGDSCPIVSSHPFISPFVFPLGPYCLKLFFSFFSLLLSSLPLHLTRRVLTKRVKNPYFIGICEQIISVKIRTMEKSELITEKKAVGRPRKTGMGWCYVPDNFSEEDKMKLGDLLESSVLRFSVAPSVSSHQGPTARTLGSIWPMTTAMSES